VHIYKCIYVPTNETRPRRQLHVQQQRRANRKDNELMGGTYYMPLRVYITRLYILYAADRYGNGFNNICTMIYITCIITESEHNDDARGRAFSISQVTTIRKEEKKVRGQGQTGINIRRI